MMVGSIIGILCPFYSLWVTHLGFLELGSSGSATTHLPVCSSPWTFSLSIGLNMLPSHSSMSCLDGSGHGTVAVLLPGFAINW